MDNDISVEIARLYVSFFNRAPDPEGLQYWMERYAAEVENGQDAALFLEEIADSFAQSPEAKAIYEQEADPGRSQIEAYITEAYFNMFGREPDDEGLAYWAERWETEMDAGRPGVRVLFEIENAARNSTNQNDIDALNNKAEVAAKFTTDFIESGAEWSDEAFEAASTILDDVDHTEESVQQAEEKIEQVVVDNGGEVPGEGQTPGGGGGGGNPGPTVPAAVIDQDGKISIGSGVAVTITETDDNIVVTRSGHITSTFQKDAVAEIAIDSTGRVDVAAGGSFTNFTGNGEVNVTGVTFTQAEPSGAANSLDTSVDIKPIILAVQTASDLTFTVNGSEADTIKALWDYWDHGYVQDFPNSYTDFEINSATIELGLRYLNYLGYPGDLENGGAPFTDIIAKGSTGRAQTLHDNLLGNLTKASVEDRDFNDVDEAAFLNRIPDAIESRPWVSGNASHLGNAAHDKARAFDYAQGWERDDWIDAVLSGTLDEKGHNGDETFYGDGNTLTGFNIVRHEGAGIELALKAKVRGGEDYDAEMVDDVAVYEVAAGEQFGPSWGPASDWSFDFSVVTGLNGTTDDLSDFIFVISIDTDAGDGVPDFVDFTYTPDMLSGVWINDDGGTLRGFGGDDGGGTDVEQNSVNFGFDAIESLLGDYVIGGAGTFDIQLAAYTKDGLDLIGVNKIQIVATDFE